MLIGYVKNTFEFGNNEGVKNMQIFYFLFSFLSGHSLAYTAESGYSSKYDIWLIENQKKTSNEYNDTAFELNVIRVITNEER